MNQKRIRELEQKISTDYGNTTGVAVLKKENWYMKNISRDVQEKARFMFIL